MNGETSMIQGQIQSLPVSNDADNGKPRSHKLLIGLSLLAAFGIRMFLIQNLDYSEGREYHSAVLARAFYYQTNTALPDWEKKVAKAQADPIQIWEPPVMEFLSSQIYRIIGAEHIGIPRALSSLWWVIGGLFLYLIAKKLASRETAFLTMAFYLFLPYAVWASRAFMALSLMILFLLISLYLVLNYLENPNAGRLLATAGTSAIAIFIYPTSAFFIAGTWISAVITKQQKGWKIPFFFLLALVPGTVYYGSSLIFNGAVKIHSSMSVHPGLIIHPSFWAGWLAQISLTAGLPAFLGSLAGLTLFKGPGKSFLIGLWASYLIYGLTFSFTISTHGYYQLVFIPIAALSLGPVLTLIHNNLKASLQSRYLAVGLLPAAVILSMAGAGVKIVEANYDRRGRWIKNEIQIAKEIGDLVGHSTKTVFLSIAMGYPLTYHGKIAGRMYVVHNEAVEKYVEKISSADPKKFLDPENLGFDPEYFIITEPWEFKRHPDLQAFLNNNFPVMTNNKDYLIYDLRKRLPNP